MQLWLFFGSMVMFIIGVGLLFGLSWALFMADLISGNNSGTYVSRQKDDYRGASSPRWRTLGLLLVVAGVFCFLYSVFFT